MSFSFEGHKNALTILGAAIMLGLGAATTNPASAAEEIPAPCEYNACNVEDGNCEPIAHRFKCSEKYGGPGCGSAPCHENQP